MTARLPDWANAACRGHDPELFFPHVGSLHGVADARAVCARCPIVRDCLVYALDDPTLIGVWGGSSHQQRQEIRAQRRKGIAVAPRLWDREVPLSRDRLARRAQRRLRRAQRVPAWQPSGGCHLIHPDAPHGQARGYHEYSCRCDACATAAGYARAALRGVSS